MESNSKLHLPNADISEKTTEKEDDSFIIPETFDLNELENTNDGNESEKSVLNYETEVAEELIGHDFMSGLPYTNIASNENEVISCKTNSTREINNDTGIKKSLRQAEHKSYVESDIESNAYSSSDEEIVLQTRICNEEGKPISNIPGDNSSQTGEHTEPNNNESDNFNKFLNGNSDCSNNEQYEKFDSPFEKEVKTIIPVKESNQNINFHALDQKDTACLGRSFTEKLNTKNKVAAETLSFELSSLSEAGDNELLTDVHKSSSAGEKIYKDSNLHSEIIQRCLDISSEVQSMCEDIETSETSTLNVIVHDFFNGTLDVDKYEINKKSPRNAVFSKDIYKTEQKEKEILNIQKNYLSIPDTQESFIRNTNSDDERVHRNKSANSKALEMKQISKKEASTIKNKRLPTVHLTKSYLNDKHKNKVHVDNNLKKYQSFDRTNGTKIIYKDQLSHGKLSYLKQDNNNKTAIKCIGEEGFDKSLHKTKDKMKPGNCQRHKELESYVMEDDKLEDLSHSNLFKDNLFQVNEVELHEKRTRKDKNINQRTSKGEIKNVSLNNKSHLFTDESKIIQERRLTSKHLNNNSPFKNIRVEQISNEVSTDIKKNMVTNKKRLKTEDIKPRYSVENANLNKRPRTWDDLENLFSNEITHDSHTLQDCYERPTTSKKDRNTSNAVNVHGINKQTKKARIQTDVSNDFSVVSHSLRNKNDTILNNNTKISPKTVSKRNNELAPISPNSNIINKIMKNMEKCTRPYLTSSKERQSILLNDPKANNDKSPIVTEYSYSIKEIQSTICYTAGETNSEEKFRNLIQSDDTKTRLCKISHKSVLNKKYNVQKQETTFKALSMTKDRCEDKSSVEMKLNGPRQTPKQWLKKENESTTSRKNNTLNNILARLEVDHNIHDSPKDVFVDNKTKLSKRRNINKNPPDLDTSISPMKSSSLSPEQGHYNLRKRKCKNYMEELDNNQSSKKKFDFYLPSGNGKSCSFTNNNSTRTKQSMDCNYENTCNTDSSCEIIDIPKQKSNQMKNGKQLKAAESKYLCPKSKNSSRPLPLPKKVATEFYKKVTRKCQEPLNSSDNSNSDTEGSIYELREFNTCVVTNETHTKVSPIVPWNEDDTFDKSNTDSNSDIFDFPKKSSIQLNKNKNRNQSKITKVKESKSSLSYPSSNKDNITEFEKPEELITKSKCYKSVNNGRAHFDSKNGHLGKIDKSKYMLKKNNELLSKAITPNKIPQQIVMKTTTNNNRHLQQTKLSSNLQIRSSLSTQNLEKSRKEDSYKMYLETIFKNTNQKTSTRQNALSTIKNQKRRENMLIEGSEENELFSLSSSDSEDYEMSTPKTGLGLLDDTLCRGNDNGEE